MRILYLISNIKQCGPYRVLESLINDSNNNTFAVISLFGNDDKKIVNDLKKKNIYVDCLNLSKFNIFFKGFKELKKVINIFKPNIIHSHGILPDYLVSKVKIAKKISTLHNNMYEDYLYSFGRIKSFILIRWHQHIYKSFDNVVCCSKSIYDYMIKKNKKIKFSYVENGIDPIKIQNKDSIREKIREELNISKEDIVFIYTGVISNRKKVVELIELFLKTKIKYNYKLLILGNGPLFEKCSDLSKHNKNIIMLGYKKDVMPYLIASDVYVSNSSSEGLSISVLEALMLDKTLLLSEIPSHIENIKMIKSYCGKNFNDESFEQIINNLDIKNNYSQEDYYLISSERMVKEYEEIYKY